MSPTPYVAVDPVRLHRNITRMQEWCDERAIALRPHVKTHKTLQIARAQLSAGAVGLTVATLGEAELFADLVAEFNRDVLIAYPVHGSPERLRRLAARVPVTIGVDSAAGVALAVEAGVPVSIEIDCGLRRSGVAPERAGELVDGHDVAIAGVFTFPGQAYAPGRQALAAAEEAAALGRAQASLAEVGLPCPVRSGGCTPSVAQTDPAAVTELRPGVYVFGDAQQLALGTAAATDIALTVRSTVVSTAVAGQFVLDAGAKLMGMDRPAWVNGHGVIPAYPHARIARMWEHHAVVETGAGSRPEIGEQVDVVPNHVCATVNLVDELVAGDHRWPVAARGRNS